MLHPICFPFDPVTFLPRGQRYVGMEMYNHVLDHQVEAPGMLHILSTPKKVYLEPLYFWHSLRVWVGGTEPVLTGEMQLHYGQCLSCT